MKTFLLTLTGIAMLCLSTTTFGQNTFTEDFTSTPVGQIPSGWTVAANTDVTAYQRFGTCGINNKGLETPGVGKGAPTGLVLPVTTFNSNYNDIKIDFAVYVFDATLKCSSQKDFPCPTYVKAYIVPASWNDPLGTPADPSVTVPLSQSSTIAYYAAQDNYEILNANANNTIIFTNVALPAGVTSYRILLNFKTADGSNCTTSGTKFVFDDFGAASSNCNNCAPVSNDDYFNTDAQNLFSTGTSFNGNVYGGYAMWANQAPKGFEESSLESSPAVNKGEDYDMNNTSLGNVTFALNSDLVIDKKGTGCAASPSAGKVKFNADGTFTYTKGDPCIARVSFTYKLTTSFGTSAATKVTIDMPGQVVGLPVRFQSFTATRQGKQVLLQWATAMEQNNKGFYLQRNTDGTWKDIGLVFSATEDGNSTIERNYTFNDLNPYSGLTQYRILQVDLDGRGHYSETRAVRGEASGSKLTIFPNPSTTGNVMVLFENTGLKDVTVSDVSGQTVQQHTKLTGSSLEIKNLRKGFYSILVHDGSTGATTAEKVIVK
jgi:Secretion system C-terminal sorting domain